MPSRQYKSRLRGAEAAELDRKHRVFRDIMLVAFPTKSQAEIAELVGLTPSQVRSVMQDKRIVIQDLERAAARIVRALELTA